MSTQSALDNSNEGPKEPSKPKIRVYRPPFEITEGTSLGSYLIRRLPSTSTSTYLGLSPLSEITSIHTNGAGHIFANGKSYKKELGTINLVDHLSALKYTLQHLVGKTFHDQFEGDYEIIDIYQQAKKRGEVMRADTKMEKAWKDNRVIKMRIRTAEGEEKEVRFASHLENIFVE